MGYSKSSISSMNLMTTSVEKYRLSKVYLDGTSLRVL